MSCTLQLIIEYSVNDETFYSLGVIRFHARRTIMYAHPVFVCHDPQFMFASINCTVVCVSSDLKQREDTDLIDIRPQFRLQTK